MALISRLPSGGNNTDIKYNSLTFTDSTQSQLNCNNEHTAIYGESVFLGTINSSCDCVFCGALITSSHQSPEHAASPTLWYEIRDKRGNILCAFTANDNTTGYGTNTSQRSFLKLKKGDNYLYVRIGADIENCGAEGVSFIFYPANNGGNCLSTTGDAPTLTWTAA